VFPRPAVVPSLPAVDGAGVVVVGAVESVMAMVPSCVDLLDGEHDVGWVPLDDSWRRPVQPDVDATCRDTYDHAKVEIPWSVVTWLSVG
jgi:hypothetical protein